MNEVAKMIWSALGAAVGWIVGEFEPAFPLVVVMVVFICADVWTAWKLDKQILIGQGCHQRFTRFPSTHGKI